MKGESKKDMQGYSSKGSSDYRLDTFVLDKGIFSSFFEKDIRRVFVYKKTERLAKAVCLVAPAFSSTPSLKDKADTIAVSLIDAATLSPGEARRALSRELLALSSLLSIGESTGALSSMNAEIIGREVRNLLQEVAQYEDPQVRLDESPSLSTLARSAASEPRAERPKNPTPQSAVKDKSKGQTPVAQEQSGRKERILSILRSKENLSIKDISTLIRDVSEKTIQRELQSLVGGGVVEKAGKKRWTTYTLKK